MKSSFSFVLVKPVYLGNIGAVARVMKNFGFKDMRLIDPPRNYKDAEARKMSVGAFDVLKEARVYDSLDLALKDINIAVATTSGQQREECPQPLNEIRLELASLSQKNKIAIVFGDERNGLTREQLNRCHYRTTIATEREFPALNLAQAAAIFSYEISSSLSHLNEETGNNNNGEPDSYSSGDIDDEAFDLLGRIFDAAGFSRKFNRRLVLGELRSFYQRARPTNREAELLTGALHRICQTISPRSKD